MVSTLRLQRSSRAAIAAGPSISPGSLAPAPVGTRNRRALVNREGGLVRPPGAVAERRRRAPPASTRLHARQLRSSTAHWRDRLPDTIPDGRAAPARRSL